MKKLTLLLSCTALVCSSAAAHASIVSKVERSAAKHELSKISKSKKGNHYFAEFDSSFSNNDKIEVNPAFKIGSYFYNNFYSYVSGSWQQTDYNTDRKMDYKLGLGWQKEVKTLVPFVELNYTQAGDTKVQKWKDNLGFDFGIKKDIKEKYMPFVKADDLFNNAASDVKMGLQYKVNDHISVAGDITAYEHNALKTSDVSLTYDF